MTGEALTKRWVARIVLGASACVLTLGVGRPADGQARVVLVVPEEAPNALVDTLVVELQLGGHEPIVQKQPRTSETAAGEPFAHAGAERVLVVGRNGRVVAADRDGAIAEARLDGGLEQLHPRIVAMVAADLAARRRRPVAASPPPPTVNPTWARLTDPSDALTPPGAPSLTRRLAAPRRDTPPERAIEEERPEPPRLPWPDWLRILTEISFGFAGSAILGVPAALATDAAGNPDYQGGWLYGYAAAGPIGYALGVWLGGLLAGGEGNLWWTLLGGVVGGLVAGAFLLAGEAIDDDPSDGVDPGFTLIGALALFAAPTTLSILGYELSSGD